MSSNLPLHCFISRSSGPGILVFETAESIPNGYSGLTIPCILDYQGNGTARVVLENFPDNMPTQPDLPIIRIAAVELNQQPVVAVTQTPSGPMIIRPAETGIHPSTLVLLALLIIIIGWFNRHRLKEWLDRRARQPSSNGRPQQPNPPYETPPQPDPSTIHPFPRQQPAAQAAGRNVDFWEK